MPMNLGLGLGLGSRGDTLWWLSGSELDLDFANNRAFNRSTGFNGSPNGILTYTSPSPKMVYGSDGVLYQSSGTLPIDHDPITHAPLGVLIEEQRTNLLTYSQEFDNAAWAKNASYISATNITAPDDTATAELFVSDTNNAVHYLFVGSPPSITSGVTYTGSVFLKKGTGSTAPDWMQLSLSSATFGSTQYANFNLTTGEVGAVGAGATARIKDVGGGWYRCSITATATSTSGGSLLVVFTNDNNALGRAPNYVGVTTSNVCVWGAQLEAGAFPTSYIPTVASQVTRAADQVGIATSAFAYNAAEGTLVAEFKGTPGIAQDIVWLANGLAESIAIYVNALSQALVWCRDGGVTQAAQTLPGSITGVDKVAYAFAANDFTGSLNGASVATDTSGTMPTPTELKLNPRTVTSATGNVHIKRLTYFPTRKTNAELQALSA